MCVSGGGAVRSPVLIKGPSTHIIYTAGDRLVLPCIAQGWPTPRYIHMYTNNIIDNILIISVC